MSICELKCTMSTYEVALMDLFQKNIQTPDRHVIPTIDYLLILHSLVTPEQQCEMYKMLCEKLAISVLVSSNVSSTFI